MMKAFLSFITTILIAGNLLAQNDYPYPSLSPKGEISQIIGNTTIQIQYERPSARQRKIFGELVPWNEVWRTGAGYCTKISFDRPIKMNGQSIEKGTYSLFTIPNPDEWIVILNRDTTLYGSYDYQSVNDIARFAVTPHVSNRFYETLNFDIEVVPNNARIYLSWENTQVYFDIETSTDRLIEQFIEERLMSGQEQDSDIYAGAAEYHLYRGTNLDQAILLADKALAINRQNGWARNLKIRIYDRLQQFQKALDEIEKAIQEINAREYKNEEERASQVRKYMILAESIQRKMNK